MYAVRVIVNQKSCLYKYLKLAAGRDTNRDSIKEFLPCLSLFQGISEAAEGPKKWWGQQKYISIQAKSPQNQEGGRQGPLALPLPSGVPEYDNSVAVGDIFA